MTSQHHRFNGALRNLFLLALACLVVAALTPAAWAQQNVDDDTIFELDGNPQDATGPTDPTGDDWQTFFNALHPTPPFTGGSALVRSFVTEDLDSVTIFTQGGSKDGNGIQQWRHTDGNVPDKDNLENAYAAAYDVGGELLLYFGADRRANNGDANIGMWFLQNPVSPGPNKMFIGEHKDGDIFVVSGFTGGGQTSEIDVYRWEGDDATGGLTLISTSVGGSTPECAPSAGGSHTACAVANTGDVASIWEYFPKMGTDGVFPVASFFEGGINVTALLPVGAESPCFSTFIMETRSSTSLTAQLKDFIYGNFKLCGLEITKSCYDLNGTTSGQGTVNPGGMSIHYKWTGTVHNTGVGTLHNVTVVDTPPATGVSNVVMTPSDGNVGDLAPDETKNWEIEFDVAGSGALSAQNSALAKGALADVSPGACESPGTVCTEMSASDTCTANPQNSLNISKNCGVPAGPLGAPPAIPETILVSEGGRAVVQVNFSGEVCNDGDTPLSNITIHHAPSGAIITPSSPLGTINPGNCTSYSGSYKPNGVAADDLGTIPGRYAFDDSVYVTGGTGGLGSDPPADATCSTLDSNAQACAGATCRMCPYGLCYTTP